jgi:hypothetical protein
VRRLSWLLIAALVLLVAVSLASAQTGEWDLTWSTIDGGGASSSSGDRFALSGTIGQPDAGSLSGGIYTLRGGFWGAVGQGGYAVYLPLIVR